MKSAVSLLQLLIVFSLLSAQIRIPRYDGDYPESDFFKGRRDALRKMMPENSAAVLFASPRKNRSNDTYYLYSQNRNFYYLTGLDEPDAVLLMFKDSLLFPDGKQNEVLFVQPRDAKSEIWTGLRWGPEGAKKHLGFSAVCSSGGFSDFPFPFDSLEKILISPFPEDVADERGKDDLYDMLQSFRNTLCVSAGYRPELQIWYDRLFSSDFPSFKELVQPVLNRMQTAFPEDSLLTEFSKCSDPVHFELLRKKLETASGVDAVLLDSLLTELRMHKSPEELRLMQKAIDITGIAHTEIMKSLKPGLREFEIQALLEFIFKRYGAEYTGFPSIVGSGENSCILHYETNRKEMKEGELVVIDIGAEYHGYSADVTRTYPINGKFTKEQKQIYDLVLKAQEAGFRACKPGREFFSPHAEAASVIQQGLLDLGIIKNAGDYRNYFMHGTSHYLGLDVHDAGTYGYLKENQVITVEPGIYIPAGSDCDPKWWNIGVRIEDDVLITREGYKILSDYAPRIPERIEQFLSEDGLYDKYIFPSVDR